MASSAFFDEDIYLPLYSYSVEKIFSNQILMFDVNFFRPRMETEIQTVTKFETLRWDKAVIYTDTFEKSEISNPPGWWKLFNIFAMDNEGWAIYRYE